MGTSLNRNHRQHGSMLLEALISILIFSIGILAIVGLQAGSVKMSSDAQYRSEASVQAGKYINAMWENVAAATKATVTAAGAAAAGVPAGTAIRFDPNEFDGFKTGGANFNAWLNEIQAALPNATATVDIATVVSCAGAACGGLIIGVIQQDTYTTANITINWYLPGCDPITTPSCQHSYRTQAIISAQKFIKG